MASSEAKHSCLRPYLPDSKFTLETTKTCIKCKENRLFSVYSKNKYGKDDLFWVCNYCLKEYYKNYIKPIRCECGRLINEKYLNTHIKSNIHKKYLTFNSEIVKGC
jgi:hypothetical protein